MLNLFQPEKSFNETFGRVVACELPRPYNISLSIYFHYSAITIFIAPPSARNKAMVFCFDDIIHYIACVWAAVDFLKCGRGTGVLCREGEMNNKKSYG